MIQYFPFVAGALSVVALSRLGSQRWMPLMTQPALRHLYMSALQQLAETRIAGLRAEIGSLEKDACTTVATAVY